MKKKILIILILIYCLLNTVSALQDIFLTIDTPDIDLCITKDFQNLACNMSTNLTLDGTSDRHIIYFTPALAIENVSNTTETTQYFMWGVPSFFLKPIIFILMTLVLIMFTVFLKTLK